MKPAVIITSVSSRVCVPFAAWENMVNHRIRKDRHQVPRTGVDTELLLQGFKTMASCSTQTPVKGKVQIGFVNKRNGNRETMDIPVNAYLLVTFTRGREEDYVLRMYNSLS